MKRFLFAILIISILAAGLVMDRVAFAGSALHINTEAGVSIWLNNELVGKTTKEEPRVIVKDLVPGEYSLRAARAGYVPVETKLVIEEDHQAYEWKLKYDEPEMKIEKSVKQIESVMLKSRPVGTLLLRSVPLDAEIVMNGESIGNTDRKVAFAPEGEYNIMFVYNGKKLSDTFTLHIDQTIELTADFGSGKIDRHSLRTDTGRGPAVIKMQTARAKKPATFPHRKHQDMYDCATCHHGRDEEWNQVPYSDGMDIQRCSTCHNPQMKNKRLNNLMQAAHARCKGCHKQVVAESGTAGPIGKCSGCHIEGGDQ